MAIEDALATWLGNQRWFAGKGQELRDLAIVADTELVAGDPELRHLIVAVSHGTAVDYYQVLVGLRRRLPARLKHARIGPSGDGRQAYDALHDADLTKPLLAGIAADAEIGSLRMRAIPGARFDTGLDSLVLGSEQSNTSLVYGERVHPQGVPQALSRPQPGPGGDHRARQARLASGGRAARLDRDQAGGRAHQPGDPVQVPAAGHRRLDARRDQRAGPVRGRRGRDRQRHGRQPGRPGPPTPPRPPGGRPPGRQPRCARPTPAATSPGNPAGSASPPPRCTPTWPPRSAPTQLGTDAVGELTERMYRKLDLAVAAVPELAKHVDMISDAYSELAKLSGPFPVQRVHGDYHLGQVLRTETGWVVLDFEGEPATPLAQRRARSSPLRDVAGMLRSFDYAARHQLIGHPGQAALSDAARDWVRRNASAFCVGYAEAGGLDPVANQVLLRALQLDKAVYEVLYEARHRPSWLPIPLDSLAEF